MTLRALFAHLATRRPGIRFRTTAAAVLVVGVALITVSVGMLALLRRSLVDNVRDAALLRAETVGQLVTAEGIERFETVPDEEYIQVLRPTGEVVASSANVAGQDLVVRLAPGDSRTVEEVPFDDDDFMVVALATSDRSYTVVVGRSLDSATETIQSLAFLLSVGLPVILGVIAVVTWTVVGRVLDPVEAIRAEVEEISMRELHRRVPRPSSDDEIARLAATMNLMLGRLEEGQHRLRRFVSDASHELRSPVTTIRQHAEVALAHPDRTSIEELAAIVFEEGLRLQRLVEDLLLLARMDETIQHSHSVVDLDDLVLDASERICQREKASIDASAVSGGRVVGDRHQLERLVGNLLENAARHSRDTIRVTLTSSTQEVTLLVEDDGPGVPEERREQIFERFVRLEEARDRDSGGAGLGLAIVSEVAAAHGGSASVKDSALGGARFEVRLAAGS